MVWLDHIIHGIKLLQIESESDSFKSKLLFYVFCLDGICGFVFDSSTFSPLVSSIPTESLWKMRLFEEVGANAKSCPQNCHLVLLKNPSRRNHPPKFFHITSHTRFHSQLAPKIFPPRSYWHIHWSEKTKGGKKEVEVISKRFSA